ncbi:MAG: HlyC/CorC family transporter [Chloracidobacterium sp.]|nr:HlyC/CorC family transporter [Chloracidobacterium sp.]
MEIEIIIAVIILIALVFLATVDMAFSQLSDVALRRISSDEEIAEKMNSAQFLREIVENRLRFRFAISSTIQVLLICFTVLLTVIVGGYTQEKFRLLFFALLIGLGATVILRQIVPRLIVKENTEQKLLFLLPAIRPIYAITSFFAEPLAERRRERLQKFDSTITPDVSDEDDDNSDDFQALMEVGEAEGIIEEKERELIETMVEFSDTRAAEIMTPRTEICAIDINSTVKDARALIIEEKYSRLPVYRDSIDQIEGIIYVRDLLQSWADGKEDQPLSEMLRDAFFVPETITASELLKRFQQNHIQIAIVIDEYGGVAGLVTVEDIIEEIVGEIEDEDTGPEEIIEIIEGEDGYFDVLGSTEIDNIERLFDIDLEDEDYTTIAGMVVTDAGYVPKPGEKLFLRGLDIEILNADEKKIHQLRLRKMLEENTTERAEDE